MLTISFVFCKRSEHFTVSKNIRRTVSHEVITLKEKIVCHPVLIEHRFVGMDKSLPYDYKREGRASSLLGFENAQN